jgi:hypothetical protein
MGDTIERKRALRATGKRSARLRRGGMGLRVLPLHLHRRSGPDGRRPTASAALPVDPAPEFKILWCH